MMGEVIPGTQVNAKNQASFFLLTKSPANSVFIYVTRSETSLFHILCLHLQYITQINVASRVAHV